MFRPGIFTDTFQESFRNKMFLFFFVCFFGALVFISLP